MRGYWKPLDRPKGITYEIAILDDPDQCSYRDQMSIKVQDKDESHLYLILRFSTTSFVSCSFRPASRSVAVPMTASFLMETEET